MTDTKDYTPEQIRELGKQLYFREESTEEDKSEALRLLLEAHYKNDPEATYYVASFLLCGRLRVINQDKSTVHALHLLSESSRKGCVLARSELNRICEQNYKQRFSRMPKKFGKRLVGFDGKPIKIDRRGLFTPVDVTLRYDEQLHTNILQINVNVNFWNLDDSIEDEKAYEKAVIDGIKLWSGHYEVFGGQQVMVCVNVTKNEKTFDSVTVVSVGEYLTDYFKAYADKIPIQSVKDGFDHVVTAKRSFANLFFGWSVHSRKMIYMQSKDGKFNRYDELTHVAKHEFGHCLGLGDLYQEQEAGLPGVAVGSYPELDCYAITDHFYHAVMCDHFGPITNNDIEMVILAFSKNKFQHFQSNKIKRISKALGKGN